MRISAVHPAESIRVRASHTGSQERSWFASSSLAWNHSARTPLAVTAKVYAVRRSRYVSSETRTYSAPATLSRRLTGAWMRAASEAHGARDLAPAGGGERVLRQRGPGARQEGERGECAAGVAGSGHRR